MDHGFKVLIVDDERGMREGCRRIVERYASRVETAESGEEALARVGAEQFDLALVDIKLPGMSGLDLLDQLKAIDADLVSIVITGYATLELAIEATRRGAYDFLPKPFTPDELLGKIWNAVERRSLAVEAKRLREERERRLLELATEKSRLRTVINCIQDAVLVTNRDGVLVLYNPAAARVLCFREGDLLGQTVAECLPQSTLTELFREVLAPEASYDMLVREFPTGEAGRVLMANVAPVRDESGEKLGAVAVLSDISELKALDRAKSQFVSMVSHELRAPLAAIEGYLSLLLNGLVKDDPQEHQMMLSRTRERAQALLGLIDDLSDISRIEAGQIAKQVRPLNLADVVREVLVLLRPQATARSVTLSDDLPSDLGTIADHEDMVRVFTNLVNNAIKYNRPGGEVRLTARTEGPYVRVDVADTGLGIPGESLDRIFDEFYRVKRKETVGIDGTGLGLHIAKRLVESYHGDIRVTSELGKGSTFSIILPGGEPEAQRPDLASAIAPDNGRA